MTVDGDAIRHSLVNFSIYFYESVKISDDKGWF